MTMAPAYRDLTRIVFGVLLIGALLAGTFWVMKPFLLALVWASMIVVATWPALQKLERAVGGRRWLATAAIVLLMLLLVVVPLVAAVAAIVEQATRLQDIKVAELHIPAPPDWVAGVPVVGAKVASEWSALAASTPEALVAKVSPYVGPVAAWIAAQAGNVGGFAIHLLLALALCGVLYMTGETAARGVRRFARRVHGERGDQLVLLAGASIRAVALGIVVTALVQTTLAALGLWAAGVPYVGAIAALILVFCIAQLGPSLPMLGAVAWLFYADATVAASLLLVWTVVVASLDNVLRPILIRRGADLPLLLIMAGVIGGLLGFGLVGLFVGPVILAVAYTLISAWVDEQDQPRLPASREP
jgi:predicted PurR-regulated permease PerM